MAQSFIDTVRAARYKLSGNGPRTIGNLLEAFEGMQPAVGADMYGQGRLINEFEDEIAALLGKEKAVFFPSGTMAQQIALRMWSDIKNTKKVAYHPLCHLEIHEQDGLKLLHHLEPILLGHSGRLFTLDDLKAVEEPLACVLIELPQREIGGQLPEWEQLLEIAQYCKGKDIKLHLDGARLFEVLPYYNKTAAEVCSLFDSVYVSFYKGLGGIAGAALAGSSDFTGQSKIWKRRHGGDLVSLYPYIISSKYFLDKRLDKMKDYWQYAVAVADRLNKIPGIETVPKLPVCNMFHVYFDASREVLERAFTRAAEKSEVAIAMYFRELDGRFMTELYFGDSYSTIPLEALDKAFAELELALAEEKQKA